ncbi:T9SS type A sorting domain-containing protein, partial [Calditrichota bacterium]
HYGTVGRMIGYYPDTWEIGNEEVDGVASIYWTYLEAANGARHVRFNRVGFTGDGEAIVEDMNGGYLVDATSSAGFVTMGMDSENNLAYPAYHFQRQGDDTWYSGIANELYNLFPGVFSEGTLPQYGDNQNLWPKIAYGEYEGDQYLHTVTHQWIPDGTGAEQRDILYSRHLIDPDGNGLVMADEQVLVTDEAMNLGADIAVSDDGSIVAITSLISRDWLYHPDDDPTQWNNDVYLWISEDGGETWDFDNPINVTNFALPDPEFLPDDTTAADTDTFRTYADPGVYIDHNDVVHVAFSTPGFFFYEGTITYTSYIYHWDEENNNYTVVADGQFWNFVRPGAWQLQVNKPSLYHDPVSGILWCVFQQYGMPGGYNPEDSTALDASDDGWANGEIMITASPPNNGRGDSYGQLWSHPVNITNTRGTAGGLVAGDCRNEREPSVALNNDGDYLNIFYVLDQDAGMNPNDEGEYTNNPAVYHRVAKMDIGEIIIDPENWALWEDTSGWVHNYPLHIDETGYWEDPYNYAWNHTEWEDGDPFFRSTNNVEDKVKLLPNEIELAQNYPNPFNGTTRISFEINRTAMVKITVYDVLGREIETLLNRPMQPGKHSKTFDAGNLSAGIYFVKLHTAETVSIRKMLLLR